LKERFPESNIFLADFNIPVYWGHISMLDAELQCLQLLDKRWKEIQYHHWLQFYYNSFITSIQNWQLHTKQITLFNYRTSAVWFILLMKNSLEKLSHLISFINDDFVLFKRISLKSNRLHCAYCHYHNKDFIFTTFFRDSKWQFYLNLAGSELPLVPISKIEQILSQAPTNQVKYTVLLVWHFNWRMKATLTI